MGIGTDWGGCVRGASSEQGLRFQLEERAWWLRLGYHGDRGTMLLGMQTPCLQHYASEGGLRNAEQNIIKKRQT